MESLPPPCVVIDRAGLVTGWNRRYLELVGISEEQLRGAFSGEVPSTPEARAVLARGMSELVAGRRFVEEYATQRPGGEPAAFRVHVSPLFAADGEFDGTLALVETGGDRLDEIARDHIVATLEATGWRIEGETGAAKRLGLEPRTLRSRMQRLGIQRER